MGPWEASAGRVRIIQRPDGEAPEWVRDAWIGLELPLIEPEPVTMPGCGVLSGPRTWLAFQLNRLMRRYPMTTGYLVPSDVAIRLLEAKDPTAASWWRTHTGSAQPGGEFIFDLPACEKVA